MELRSQVGKQGGGRNTGPGFGSTGTTSSTAGGGQVDCNLLQQCSDVGGEQTVEG